MNKLPVEQLREAFGGKLSENIRMADYTTAHIGGSIPVLITITALEELIRAAKLCWKLSIPFRVIGSGSNILVSDLGLDYVILHNRANTIEIYPESDPPSLYAESGAILGTVARQSAIHGLSGMEWAAPVPGTVGGAVYGNAGAHGSDMAGSVHMATILHKKKGLQDWPVDKLAYQYRSSILKRQQMPVVVLSALFKLVRSSKQEAWRKIKAYQAHRKETQPPGASMGSIFKNPSGDFAGRLIEAAGLKGQQIGKAMISPIHANFMINLEDAAAEDIFKLIKLCQKTVKEKFGIQLEPEIELLGEFK